MNVNIKTVRQLRDALWTGAENTNDKNLSDLMSDAAVALDYVAGALSRAGYEVKGENTLTADHSQARNR